MSEISKTADELTEIAQTHVAPLLMTLRDVLDVEGRGALASVSTLSGALAEEAPQIMANIEDATANVADITSRENTESIRRTIDNVERVSKDAVAIADDAAAVTSGVMRVASDNNLKRIETILNRLDSAAIELEETMRAANRSAAKMENTINEDNMIMVSEFLADMRRLQRDIGQIAATGIETSENLYSISEFSEDRLAGFLQRMEAAALNIEEMTARLRDDPSLIIRGSE